MIKGLKLRSDQISVYIHIPFCDSKCFYCSFISSVENDERKHKYFKALEQEINDCELNGYKVQSVYFGGGTPSCVDAEFIEKTLKYLREKFSVNEDAEITIEVNPNSVDREKLFQYKKIGINRLSIGVQSFNKRSLNFIGRVQGGDLKSYKKKTLEVLKVAKTIGFENISVDFILGLPYQTTFQIKSFLKQLTKHVTHFSCYMLLVEEGTKLFKLLPEGVDEIKLAKQYETAVKSLEKWGFKRYEISNFAKKSFESRHNKTYWELGEYIGFGVAAHSFFDGNKIANTQNLREFIDSCLSGRIKDIKNIEELSDEELAREKIMLALRTERGLDLVEFKEKFYDLESKKASQLAFLLNLGFIEFENNFLRLSSKGYLLANKIILDLID